MDEKIGAPRYKVVKLNIVYDTGEEFWSGPVVDASETGIFVETVHQLEPGSRVTVLPEMGGDEEASEMLPFELTAEVVRINEYDIDNRWDQTPGIAFLWVDMTDEQKAQLRQFLQVQGVLVRR